MDASRGVDDIAALRIRACEQDTATDDGEPVWIMFITDTETRDRLMKFGTGSQWQVESSTAAAMILVGAAVKVPSALDTPPVPGVGGMSMPGADSG